MAIVILLLADCLTACGNTDDGRVGSSSSGLSTYAPLPRDGDVGNRSAAEAADRFAGTWARNDLPDQKWRTAVLPLVTPELGEKLTDLRKSAKAVGSLRGPASFAGETNDDITFTVAAQGGMLHVTLVQGRPYWLVSRIHLDPH